MGCYVTSVLVAVVVVGSMLGLLNFTHGNMDQALQANIESMDQDKLIESAKNPESKTRIDSILKLGEEPGDLTKTMPLLAELSMSHDELVRIAAGISLKEIGAEGLPHLKPYFDSDDLGQVVLGCSAIKELDAGGREYLPAIKKLMATKTSSNRKRGLYAMLGVGKDSVELLDMVVDSLDDPDFNTQLAACRVLEILGPDAIAAEKKILQLMKEGLPSVRGWAALVMGAIGPTDKTNTAQLLADNLSTAPIQIELQRTLLGICHLGPEASSVTSDVRQLMLNTNKHVMPHAAYTLWKVTGEPEESLEVFKQLLLQRSYRDDAIEFVGKMASEGAPLVDDLANLLSDPEEATREVAVVALGNIGAAAASAVDRIEPLLKDKDPLIRYYARTSLEQIKKSPQPEAN